MRAPLSLMALVAAALAVTAAAYVAAPGPRWTPEERDLLRSLSLASLGPVPADPSNRVADDEGAARLGHRLFFDVQLSGPGTVSCATCHPPDQAFQDGLPLGQGVGTSTRRTMPVAGTAHSPWQFWDGRAGSQWEQALGPLENPVEHGGDRTQVARRVAAAYREAYEAVFGPLPDLPALPAHAGPVAAPERAAAWAGLSEERRDEVTRVFANVGKAIAAYERRVGFAPSRFDRYVEAELAGRPHTPESALTRDEEAGLRLFIGEAGCTTCHNGPLLTDHHFHNTGVPAPHAPLPPDSGRAAGVRQALAGEFACTGPYSDAGPGDCQELRFAVVDGPELVHAFKPPSLRGVAERAPYMHAGQVATLDDVVAHYAAAPAAPFGHSELRPLRLSERERRQLVAFLRTLSGPLDAPPGFLAPPAR